MDGDFVDLNVISGYSDGIVGKISLYEKAVDAWAKNPEAFIFTPVIRKGANDTIIAFMLTPLPLKPHKEKK